jgi:RHS repeat-associated protein
MLLSMIEAAKEEMHSSFPKWCADPALAARMVNLEKPHQGVAPQNLAPHQGITWSNSTTALGLRGARLETRVRSRCTGKERDAESGLDYFGRRHYASTMGRWMTPDPLNLTSARLVNPTNTLNKYVYGGNNPLKYIDRDGEDITIFYRPSGLSPTDFGHIFIGALNQNTGKVGFLDYYPQGRGNGPGQFNTGNMQDRAATSDQFATLTIRTSPEQAQKVLDLIKSLTEGKPPDYAALSNNCTTICEDVLHDLGLDFGDVFPDNYWAHVYGNFAPEAQDNPFKNFFVPRKTGVEYGNPRNFGVATPFSQWLFQLYLNQQQKQQPKACVEAHDSSGQGTGTHCE